MLSIFDRLHPVHEGHERVHLICQTDLALDSSPACQSNLWSSKNVPSSDHATLRKDGALFRDQVPLKERLVLEDAVAVLALRVVDGEEVHVGIGVRSREMSDESSPALLCKQSYNHFGSERIGRSAMCCLRNHDRKHNSNNCGDSAKDGHGSKIGTCDSRCESNVNWRGFTWGSLLVRQTSVDTQLNEQGLFDKIKGLLELKTIGCP